MPVVCLMNGKLQQPKTLQDAIVYFDNPDNALAYMVRLRWPDGVVTCPKCRRKDAESAQVAVQEHP